MILTPSSLSQIVSNRRLFVQNLGLWPLIPIIGDALSKIGFCAAPVFTSNPFTLGVASGDPTPDGVVLWTRLAPNPLEGGGMAAANYDVHWEIANDESFREIVQKGVATATPQLGHSIHVEVSSLPSDRWFFYRFRCGDYESRIGKTRTMPEKDTTPAKLRFAFTSCQSYEQGLYTGYQHMLAEQVDLVVHLGDYIYEYGGIEKKIRLHLGNEIASLDDYRNRHAQYRLDEHLQTMHAECPWLLVWDDHEVDNNYVQTISEESNVDRWTMLSRRCNAYQAYYEMMPLRKSSLPAGEAMTIFRTIDFGQLASFQMLDTRQYRSDQPNNDGDKPLEGDVFNRNATVLGTEQNNWLKSRLLQSTSIWNVLAQQIMMARIDLSEGEKSTFSMDQWSGYHYPRQDLVDFITTRKISNPIVLSGDIHSNWINDIVADFDRPESQTVATEFVCTSIASGGNGVDRTSHHDHLFHENPFLKFHNAQRGYTVCEVTPKQWKSDYRVLDFVDRPNGAISTRASYVVEHGTAGAQQV